MIDPDVVYITASITASSFLREQIALLGARGHRPVLLTGPPGPQGFPCAVEVVSSLVRDPRPWDDVRALLGLWRCLRRLRPNVVHASTPKAALLGLIAARLARVPRRVYLVRGLRLESASGPARRLLASLERLTCRMATDILVVSESLGDEMVREGLVARDRVVLLGSGASAGVDTARFRPPTPSERTTARDGAGIPEGAFVVAFVGRLRRDKGFDTLMQATDRLGSLDSGPVRVLVAGEAEGTAAWIESVEQWLARPDVVYAGRLDDVLPIYRAADVLALPTLREGLPNVVLEASACGLPVVVTDATGARDAVEPDVTGLLVPIDDVSSLSSALRGLGESPDRGAAMGAAGRRRVQDLFERAAVAERHVDFVAQIASGR